ncbi:XRE family transcriptional regulator [Paraeggerthella hongkongensis]|nr:XRE family transcriptional regulator [Paraeggerthella hongkongensis]
MQAVRVEPGGLFFISKSVSRISTNKFALMVWLSGSFVVQIEHGRRSIFLDAIERIAAGLNMTVSELFEGVENA